MLTKDFLDPDAIATGQTTVFDQLPKRRLREKLKGIPGGELVTGWGVDIEESEDLSGRSLLIDVLLWLTLGGFAAAVFNLVQTLHDQRTL
jgi:hypothetical protein